MFCVCVQKCRMFRVCYKESGLYMSVQGGVDTMKTGRVVVSENVEGVSDVWFYQDGLIKNKVWVLLLRHYTHLHNFTFHS